MVERVGEGRGCVDRRPSEVWWRMRSTIVVAFFVDNETGVENVDTRLWCVDLGTIEMWWRVRNTIVVRCLGDT